ncbi:TM0106 family RecB-like putative nuclease [Propionibacterium australiense]|uniref:Ribonuclease H-like domain n=1 Tax=Propionibacterium australiense TaxID=119981 RepID=A0A383S3G3_9ACTN|nr:TM0106 family RecB-like putative nuclease [Propionibacterium australiense]RLP12624.1 TM0106 family RecB-like putative nuclease [Propionibacterium australiense]SYZ32545.1 Ribonuclease H-like domain [Propionibacterium australiense]VEH91704.1 putative RecB family nuclease, TM0106 family [Propionibacterium australiense]
MGRSARRRARARRSQASGRPGSARAVVATPEPTGLVLLDADSAVSCPVRTHNRFDPTVPDPPPDAAGAAGRPPGEPPADRRATAAFRRRVLDTLAGMPRAVDLRGLGPDRAGRLEATARAVAAGRRIIICPALPHDVAGGRTGEPDAIILGEPAPDGGHGYDPVLVVRHRVLEQVSPVRRQRASSLAHNLRLVRLRGSVVRPGRVHDLLRLAHYRRILQAAGWASGESAHGGLIGTDHVRYDQGIATVRPASPRHMPPPSHLVLVWADLAARRLRTESRTALRGWRTHSALARYDHEFGFRLKIAAEAAGRTPATTRAPRVWPVVTAECESCCWWLHCRRQLDDDDLSLRIDKARLNPQEVSLLRSMGVWTIRDLAGRDVDELIETLRSRLRRPDEAAGRVRLAARRARMLSSGRSVERTTRGPLRLPPEGYAIDLDIETSANDTVYLWGFLVDDPQAGTGPRYVPFARFTDLDRDGEQELAHEALTWLGEQLTAHPEARVYHYSDYEVVHIRRIAQASGDPVIAEFAHGDCASRFFDLFALVRANFFGVHGLGLKRIAHDGAGFSWRDEEAGGLNSQTWFDEAVHAAGAEQRREEAQRVLDYNEDDVRATHALRAWLRTLT